MSTFRTSPPRATAGQAMIEFMVGIVCVIVVVGALLQLGTLCRERTQTMMNATRHAHLDAVSDTFAASPPAPFTLNWNEAGDGYRHSADDIRIGGDPAVVGDAIAGTAQPGWLEAATGEPTPFSGLTDTAGLQEANALVSGTDSRIGIRLLPVVRNLIYRDNTITVRSEAWMVYGDDL